MKRVLIVNSNSINIGNATGITLQSILGRLNPENLMELYWNKSACLNGNVKLKSIVLEYAPISLAALILNSKGKRISKKIKTDINSSDFREHGNRKIISHIRQFISLQTDLSKVRLTQKNLEEIRAFNPEVIYTLGGGVASLKMSYSLSLKLNIPVVIHFMDNWRHCIQWEDNPLLAHYKRQLRKYCNLCYTRSRECIAISPQMAQVYTKETGVHHSTLMNSVNVDEFYCEPRKKDGVFKFVYAGGLHLGREKGLYEIGKAIHKAAENKGISAELLIYTSPENIEVYKDVFKELPEVKFAESVPHNEIKKVLSDADFLVHTESDALIGNGFFKYSISTKIPEYLSSGRPVLFYGPSDIYLYEFLNKFGVAITASDKNILYDRIADMLDGKYDAMPEKAYFYAKDHFDTVSSVDLFCNIINNSELETEQ